MGIDFSTIDTSVIDGMALTLAVFAFGTIAVLIVLAGLLSLFKIPRMMRQPIITFAAIGCLFYWVNNFL